MARVADLPASNLIRFLSSYGPEDSNLNLFDENVTSSAKRYKINPIELQVEDVNEIDRLLKSDTPCSVLIAGVAGDGKSYHLRHIWQALGGSDQDWEQDGDPQLIVHLNGGQTRELVFVKDLTAGLTQFADLWSKMCRSAHDLKSTVVMACNHGQILSQLRALKDDDAEDFANQLEDAFFSTQTNREINGIRIYDLSRVSQAARLQEIIEKIAMHSSWDACLHGSACPHRAACFIHKNIELLWDRENNRPTTITNRLCTLVELAGYNGNHFPIRELFMLVVNAVLGLEKSARGRLGNCHFVQSKCRNDASDSQATMNLFSNLLGQNLSERIRSKKVLFEHLAEFEVGSFSHPFFDQLILLGEDDPHIEMHALYKKYLGDMPKLSEYKKGDLSASACRAMWLEEARRRIFFQWDEPDGNGGIAHENDLWSLTAFSHAAQYLQLRKETHNAGDEQDIPSELLAGLNRIMTGSAAFDNDNIIRLATNGAYSQDPVGMIVVGQLTTDDRFGDRQAVLVCDDQGADAVPVLLFRRPGSDNTIRFNLTPRRYELLVNLQEGTLPTSFSKQSQTEFYSLKALLVRAVTEKTHQSAQPAKKIKLTFLDNASDVSINYMPKQI